MSNSASSAMPPPPSSTFILPTPTISFPLSQSIPLGFSSKAAIKRRACSSCPRPLSVGGSIPLSTGPHGDLRQTISKRPILPSHDAHAIARTRHPLRFPPLTVVSTSAPDVSQPPPASASRRNTVGKDAYLRRKRRRGNAQAMVQCDPSPTALPASLTTPPPPPPLASPTPPLTAETPDQATPPSLNQGLVERCLQSLDLCQATYRIVCQQALQSRAPQDLLPLRPLERAVVATADRIRQTSPPPADRPRRRSRTPPPRHRSQSPQRHQHHRSRHSDSRGRRRSRSRSRAPRHSGRHGASPYPLGPETPSSCASGSGGRRRSRSREAYATRRPSPRRRSQRSPGRGRHSPSPPSGRPYRTRSPARPTPDSGAPITRAKPSPLDLYLGPPDPVVLSQLESLLYQQLRPTMTDYSIYGATHGPPLPSPPRGRHGVVAGLPTSASAPPRPPVPPADGGAAAPPSPNPPAHLPPSLRGDTTNSRSLSLALLGVDLDTDDPPVRPSTSPRPAAYRRLGTALTPPPPPAAAATPFSVSPLATSDSPPKTPPTPTSEPRRPRIHWPNPAPRPGAP